MSEAETEERVCEDRISNLPEDLLVKILLLITTKDAIATMILSKQWRFIWTMLPRLEFKDNKEEDDENKKSICYFLDKLLQLHKAPVIDSLDMELGPRCVKDANIGEWIEKAVDCRVRVLRLTLRDPIRLPKSLYTCKTLVELTLSDKILVDPPFFPCLPSLIILYLFYVVYEDESSLKFLSNCPALKYLTVLRKRYDNVKKFTVKVPSLCSLSYNNGVGDTDGYLVIDTPALECISIVDSSDDYCSIENMPFLEDAYISVNSYPDDKILRSISLVLSLNLSSITEVLVRCSAINFSRLKVLSICPKQSDCLEPLMLWLGNAPNLNNLTLDYSYTERDEDLQLSWNQPSSVPGCLSSQLEIFEWKRYRNRKEEREFLTYILANSKCLKTATISFSSTCNEQGLIVKELKDIPRVSTASQLLF